MTWRIAVLGGMSGSMSALINFHVALNPWVAMIVCSAFAIGAFWLGLEDGIAMMRKVWRLPK